MFFTSLLNSSSVFWIKWEDKMHKHLNMTGLSLKKKREKKNLTHKEKPAPFRNAKKELYQYIPLEHFQNLYVDQLSIKSIFSKKR